MNVGLGETSRKYRYPQSNTMPILFENHQIVVYENGSGEIYIETKADKSVTMRVSPGHTTLSITASNGRLVPTSVNGLSAIAVTPR